MTAAGQLVGVGVGPGDPELLTLKAVRAIGACPVLAAVAAAGRPSFARRIVAAHTRTDQREITIELPMKPLAGAARTAYDEASARIASELDRGDDVALLCEGDPLLYGSFIQVMARLGGLYACQVIPGVTSISAAAAAACLPLAWRRHALIVLPATLPPDVLEERLRGADAAAILKVGRHLGAVREVLGRTGALPRARLVEWASTVDQRVLPLAEAQGPEAPYFSIVLVPPRNGA